MAAFINVLITKERVRLLIHILCELRASHDITADKLKEAGQDVRRQISPARRYWYVRSFPPITSSMLTTIQAQTPSSMYPTSTSPKPASNSTTATTSNRPQTIPTLFPLSPAAFPRSQLCTVHQTTPAPNTAFLSPPRHPVHPTVPEALHRHTHPTHPTWLLPP